VQPYAWSARLSWERAAPCGPPAPGSAAYWRRPVA